jgi:hypothetical protein
MMRHHAWREATSQGEIHGALSGPLWWLGADAAMPPSDTSSVTEHDSFEASIRLRT